MHLKDRQIMHICAFCLGILCWAATDYVQAESSNSFILYREPGYSQRGPSDSTSFNMNEDGLTFLASPLTSPSFVQQTAPPEALAPAPANSGGSGGGGGGSGGGGGGHRGHRTNIAPGVTGTHRAAAEEPEEIVWPEDEGEPEEIAEAEEAEEPTSNVVVDTTEQPSVAVPAPVSAPAVIVTPPAPAVSIVRNAVKVPEQTGVQSARTNDADKQELVAWGRMIESALGECPEVEELHCAPVPQQRFPWWLILLLLIIIMIETTMLVFAYSEDQEPPKKKKTTKKSTRSRKKS